MAKEDLVPLDSKRAAEIGRLGGKAKKGSKHISTHIRNMLNDPNFELKLENGEVIKGAPMEAIIKTAIAKAVSGDIRAFDILAKRGWGDKIDMTSGGQPLTALVKFADDNGTDEDNSS